jgi:uncharacterized caspase-like protein
MNKKILLFAAIALFLLVRPQYTCPQGKIYAVLAGVSEYANANNNLTYSHTDAIEMYRMLRAHTHPAQIKLLTNQNAACDNIVYHTRQLFAEAQPDDIVIFYFSGHGNNGMFFSHDKPLYFSTLSGIFKQCKAKRKMVFADACLSGTLRKSSKKNPAAKTGLGKNVLFFLSSRSNQSSIESFGLKNGVFTYFLLAGLKGGADNNGDKFITAKELFNFVYPKVKEHSGGVQVPVMWGKFDKNMVILKLRQ